MGTSIFPDFALAAKRNSQWGKAIEGQDFRKFMGSLGARLHNFLAGRKSIEEIRITEKIGNFSFI